VTVNRMFTLPFPGGCLQRLYFPPFPWNWCPNWSKPLQVAVPPAAMVALRGSQDGPVPPLKCPNRRIAVRHERTGAVGASDPGGVQAAIGADEPGRRLFAAMTRLNEAVSPSPSARRVRHAVVGFGLCSDDCDFDIR